ncbi:hypothetical protein D3C72_1648410 [compost metagenome]
MNIRKIGVIRRIKSTGKQPIDIGAAELAGWQADIVDHQQRRRLLIRAKIAMRRDNPGYPDNPALF